MNSYIVFTTATGIVYEGQSEDAARSVFSTYAYGDMQDTQDHHSVILFKNDEPILDYNGNMKGATL